MKVGTWLLALLQPAIARILVALGFSVVSIVGFESAVGALKNQLISSVNSMPAEMLQLFLYAGGGRCLGIIFGAIATRVLLWQIQNATKILGVNPS